MFAGKEATIDSTQVHVGDLIVMKQGDSIVADGVFVLGTGMYCVSFL